VHLRDVGTGLGAQGLALQGGSLGAQLGQAGGVFALLAIVQRHGGTAFVVLHVAPAGDPATAHAGQALAHIDHGFRVGVRAGGVVHADQLAVGERDVAHRHAQVGVQLAGDIGLARCRKGFACACQQLGKLFRGGELGVGIGGVHGQVSWFRWRWGLLRNGPVRPPGAAAPGAWRANKNCGHGDKEVGSSSAGMNRIKFVGFASSPEFLQDPCISAHQHTPEQARV